MRYSSKRCGEAISPSRFNRARWPAADLAPAETDTNVTDVPETIKLQWGRGSVPAEICCDRAIAPGVAGASMGPRICIRGNSL